MERRLISDPMISCCLKSVLPCNLVQFLKFVLGCSLKTARHYFILSLLTDDRYNNRISNNNPKAEEEGEEEEEEHHHHDHDYHHQEITQSNCDRHEKETEMMITCDDIDMDTVMSSIGIDEWRNNIHKQNRDLVREAHEFLDSKDASLEELKEAFYVFDRNEDGFITAFELWSVLRRLEMKEGMRYEDCEEMIRVYDKDGDGRINFSEFNDMMEQAL